MEFRSLKIFFYFEKLLVLCFALCFLSPSAFGLEVEAVDSVSSNVEKDRENDSFLNSYDQTKSTPILMSPLDQHYKEINYFQEDCLKLISPPTLFFNKIETQPTQTKNFFLLRLTGKLPKEKNLDFSKNYIEFIDHRGQIEKLAFDPQVFQIQSDRDGESLLSFIAPSSRTIKIGFVFRQKTDQEYDLNIEISKNGDIKRAVFLPILNSEKKLNFCAKSLIKVGANASLSEYSQRLASINSDVYAAPQVLQFNFNWSQVVNRREQRIFSIEGGLQEMPLPESDLFSAQTFSTVHFQTQYLWQFRENRYNTIIANSVISPYYRLGMAIENIDIYKFNEANLVTLDRSSSIQFVGGIGLSSYISKFWMMDFSGDMKVQGYGTGFVKNYLSFEGQWSIHYQPQWRWKNSFLGMNTKLIYSELTYERENGLDKNGSVNNLTAQAGLFWGFTF